MFDNAKYIVVEGPVGSGKTVLAQRLAQYLGAKSILTQPELNPFLGHFYQNTERWAFTTQVSFLFQRIDRLAELGEMPDSEQRMVSDFLIDKDLLFAELSLTPEEFALYQRIFDSVRPTEVRQPDLVIYLQAKPETLINRIRQHSSNNMERHIAESYFEVVTEGYASFFYEYNAAPLLIIDTEVLNPMDQDSDFELLLNRLRQMRSYREFFGYAG